MAVADSAAVSGGLSRHVPVQPPGHTIASGAVAGLRDADLATLCSLAPIRVLDAGDFLLRAGDRDPAIHLLIKGEVLLQDGTGATLLEMGPGDSIGGLDSDAADVALYSTIARGPASVLSLSRETYDGLGEGIKLRLLSQRQLRQQALMQRLAARDRDLSAQNQALVEALYHSRLATDTGFSRSEAVGEVIRKVPRLPVSTATLLAKLFDERTSHAEVVDLVKSDPSLTSTLLKAVNSPLYSLQHKIDNVNHAVTLLGFDAVHQLILSESMRKSLPETPRFREIYQRSLETSQLAFATAQAVGVGRPAEVSTIGLLREIGGVVLELLKSQNPRLEGLLATMDSAGLGAELLRAWNLPEGLCRSIQFQHYPEFALPEHVPGDVRENVALLHLANRFRDRIHAADVSRNGPFPDAYLAALGLTGVGEQDLFLHKVRPRLMARPQALPKSLADALAS
ncbi:MAG: HDOD domain-containing protein [Thioalkalivibrio sp.]|nr:MAG: HDOD domain-containing protein [Thioalkalivibrio sp.]